MIAERRQDSTWTNLRSPTPFMRIVRSRLMPTKLMSLRPSFSIVVAMAITLELERSFNFTMASSWVASWDVGCG